MDFKNPAVILSVIALGLAIGGVIRPQWPLVHVAVMLLAIAVLLIANK